MCREKEKAQNKKEETQNPNQTVFSVWVIFGTGHGSGQNMHTFHMVVWFNLSFMKIRIESNR